MHFASYILPVLASMSMLAIGLPTDRIPADNTVARYVTSRDGTQATVHINRNLAFVSAPTGSGSATTRLSRRKVQFTPDPINDDYCSETFPTETFGSDAPLAADCLVIKAHLETVDGYYTVSPGDFDASNDGWATVATSGTCSFGIKFQIAADQRQVAIGTNDAHFYIQGYVGDAEGGRIKAVGTISCINDGQMLLLFWGMIHS